MGDFKTKLILKDHDDWLDGLLDIRDVLRFSLYQAKCLLSGSKLTYEYKFTPFSGMDRVEPRKIIHSLTLGGTKHLINLNDHNIGPVQIQLYVFDQDARVLKLGDVSDKKGLKEFLNESGGVRVYRGGIRVYD